MSKFKQGDIVFYLDTHHSNIGYDSMRVSIDQVEICDVDESSHERYLFETCGGAMWGTDEDMFINKDDAIWAACEFMRRNIKCLNTMND